MEKALKVIGECLKGSNRRKESKKRVLTGVILIALKNKYYREKIKRGIQETNQGEETILSYTIVVACMEIDKIYKEDRRGGESLKKYYKENLSGRDGLDFKINQTSVDERMYSLIKAIEEQLKVQDGYELYESWLNNKREENRENKLLKIMLNLPEARGENTAYMLTTGTRGVENPQKTLKVLNPRLNNVGINEYTNVPKGTNKTGLAIIERGQESVKKRVKEREQGYNKVVLDMVGEYASKIQKGGRLIIAVPLSAISWGVDRDYILEKHTLESVISIRVPRNYGYTRPMSILVITANKPQKRGHKTYLSYWGISDENPEYKEIEENLEKYTQRKEQRGMSIHKEIQPGDEWSVEQHIEMDYGYKGVKMLGVSELFTIEDTGVDIKVRGIEGRGLELKGEPREGYLPVIGIREGNNGIAGYLEENIKGLNVSKGGCILLNHRTSFYQEGEYISNTKSIKLTPKKEMQKEELEYYAEILKQDKKRYDYCRTAIKQRVEHIKIPLYKTQTEEQEVNKWVDGGIKEQEQIEEVYSKELQKRERVVGERERVVGERERVVGEREKEVSERELKIQKAYKKAIK